MFSNKSYAFQKAIAIFLSSDGSFARQYKKEGKKSFGQIVFTILEYCHETKEALTTPET